MLHVHLSMSNIMSHFLDRLTYFKNTKTVLKKHGVMTDENRLGTFATLAHDDRLRSCVNCGSWRWKIYVKRNNRESSKPISHAPDMLIARKDASVGRLFWCLALR